MTDIQKELFSFRDKKYLDFQAPLIPNASRDSMIGVRMPILKRIAKKHLSDFDFLNTLPHTYLEENHLHSLILSSLPFDECVVLVERFLPFVDNWATCDSLRPKCFKRNKDRLLPFVFSWLDSSHIYTVRFGIEMLMVHFLGEDFKMEYAERVSKIETDEYYLNMMIAWYFATALAKKQREILPFFENGKIPEKAYAKAVQKSRESLCIPTEIKEYLSRLKKDVKNEK